MPYPAALSIDGAHRSWDRLASAPGMVRLFALAIPMVSSGAFFGRTGVVFAASVALGKDLNLTLGDRVSGDVERPGQDAGELGIEAYPDFVLMPEQYDED